MAIDTAAKRYSMINLAHHHAILIIPDGTIGDADRAHLLGLYSGIALGEPTVGVPSRAVFRRHSHKPRRWK